MQFMDPKAGSTQPCTFPLPVSVWIIFPRNKDFCSNTSPLLVDVRCCTDDKDKIIGNGDRYEKRYSRVHVNCVVLEGIFIHKLPSVVFMESYQVTELLSLLFGYLKCSWNEQTCIVNGHTDVCSNCIALLIWFCVALTINIKWNLIRKCAWGG